MTRIRSVGTATLACALVWTVACTVAARLWTPAAAQDTIDRPINIYVAGTAGGGIDLYARVLARHFGRHVPGKPTVNVQVMPGAGGIRAANFLTQQAPKDGTAITTFAGGPILEPLIGSRKLDYDSSHFTWIGAVSKDVGLCIAWGASPFKTIKDAQRETMVVAGTGAGSDTDTWPVILNELIGTKFKLVTGYQGTQETVIAIERGEAHGRCTFSYSALKTAKPDWLRDKKINILTQLAFEKHKDFPDAPLIYELVIEGGGPAAARPHDRPERDGAAVRRTAGTAAEDRDHAAPRLRRDHEGPGLPRRGRKDPGRDPADQRRGRAEARDQALRHAQAGGRTREEVLGPLKSRP